MSLRSRLRIRVLNCLRLAAEQQNNAPNPKRKKKTKQTTKNNNAAAGYKGLAKKELLKDAGLRQ